MQIQIQILSSVTPRGVCINKCKLNCPDSLAPSNASELRYVTVINTHGVSLLFLHRVVACGCPFGGLVLLLPFVVGRESFDWEFEIPLRMATLGVTITRVEFQIGFRSPLFTQQWMALPSQSLSQSEAERQNNQLS